MRIEWRSLSTWVTIVELAALALVWLVIVYPSHPFDREIAIAQVITDSGDRITRAQAECYVDRVRSRLGTRVLMPGAQVPIEKVSQLTSIRVDCVGVENLGRMSSEPDLEGPTTSIAPGDNRPRRPGDDPAYDELYRACGEGWGSACDDLFDRAVVGSEYERFAGTCGARTYELSCAAVYPSPGVTLPSDAQPTTTSVPSAP